MSTGTTLYDSTAAISAASFLDTLGVNVHTTYSNTVYANTAVVEQSLEFLNFNHLRDGINAVGAYNSVGQEKLAADGYKFDFVTGVPTASKMAALDWYAINHPGSVFSVEGPNEIGYAPIYYDGGTGVTNEIALQQALYDAVHADPNLSGVNVVNFTLGLQNSMSYSDLGDMSSAADQGNAHVYAPYGFAPVYDWSQILAMEGAPTPGRPMVITEAGYTTAPNYISGVNETVQAKYTLDLLMDSARSGVAQIYLYELLDEKPDAAGISNQQHYGLFRNDGTAKPAATAIHNLTTILADSSGTASAPHTDPFSYAVTGLPANGFEVLFEKQKGIYDIALWAEPNIWNSTLHQEVVAPINTVTVAFSHIEHTVTVYDPLLGTTPIATYSDVSQIDVSITDHPLIVEVDDGITITAADPVVQPPSISIDAGAGGAVRLTGTATPGATVKLYDGGNPVTEAIASALDGSFQIENLALATGKHVLTAAAYDSSSHASELTTALVAEIGTASDIAAKLSASQIEPDVAAILLTDTHVLPVASVSAMQAIISNNATVLPTIKGGYSFAVTTSVVNGRNNVFEYDGSGVLKSTTLNTYKLGVLSASTTTFSDGSLDTRTYTGGALTGETIKYAPGSADLSETKVFTAGDLIRDTIAHADNSKDIYITHIQNQTYVAEHDAYNAAGVLISTVRTHADGSLAYTYSLAADGTKIREQYDAAGALKSDSVVHADGSSDARTYAGGVLTGETIKYAPGSAELSETKVFSAGDLIRDTIVHADNSKDIYITHIQNQSYVAEHDAYNAAGVLISTVRTHADGSLAYTYDLAADGTKTRDQYDAAGTLKSDSVVHADGSSDTRTYAGGVLTGETIKYAPGSAELSESKVFSAGDLIRDTIVHADNSKDVFDMNITGKPYVAVHFAYDSNGKLEFTDLSNSDGSHTVTAYVAGLNLTSTAGVVDLFKSSVAGGDNFAFNPGFGNDKISGFHAGGAIGHDVISIDDSLVADYDHLHLQASGSDTLINIEADKILLIGVAPSSLTAANFQFVHHDWAFT